MAGHTDNMVAADELTIEQKLHPSLAGEILQRGWERAAANVQGNRAIVRERRRRKSQ